MTTSITYSTVDELPVHICCKWEWE